MALDSAVTIVCDSGNEEVRSCLGRRRSGQKPQRQDRSAGFAILGK